MPDIFISDIEKENKEEAPTPEKPVEKAEFEPAIDTEDIKGHTHNPLTAYAYWPEHVNFETQDRKEKIVLLLRRHPITNLGWMFISLVLLIAPTFLSRLTVLALLPGGYKFIILLAWYLVAASYIFQKFMDWYFNVYIITDQRVIDMDFINLVYKEVSDAHIDKIQDVTYKMGGVVRTIFNFGDVFVQTAGEIENLDFEAVANPARVAKILQDLRLAEEKKGRNSSI